MTLVLATEMGREAFRDTFAVEWLDDSQHPREARYALIGMVEGRLPFVAYTLRAERIRIVSARKPEPQERRKYHDEDREP